MFDERVYFTLIVIGADLPGAVGENAPKEKFNG